MHLVLVDPIIYQRKQYINSFLYEASIFDSKIIVFFELFGDVKKQVFLVNNNKKLQVMMIATLLSRHIKPKILYNLFRNASSSLTVR